MGAAGLPFAALSLPVVSGWKSLEPSSHISSANSHYKRQVHACDAAAHLRGGAAPAQGAKPLKQGPEASALPRLQAPRSRAAMGQLAPPDPAPALWGDGLLGTLAQTLPRGEGGPGAAAACERGRQAAERQSREAEARRRAIAEREARARALFAKCGPARFHAWHCMHVRSYAQGFRVAKCGSDTSFRVPCMALHAFLKGQDLAQLCRGSQLLICRAQGAPMRSLPSGLGARGTGITSAHAR